MVFLPGLHEHGLGRHRAMLYVDKSVEIELKEGATLKLASGVTKLEAEGEITTLEGESIKHKFLMGSDSFGRDIYSRVIYGTRVSLVVGIACALLSVFIGVLAGPPTAGSRRSGPRHRT